MKIASLILPFFVSVKSKNTFFLIKKHNYTFLLLVFFWSFFCVNQIFAQDLNTEWLRVFKEEKVKENPDARKVQDLYTKYVNSDSFVKTNDVSECKHWLKDPKTWGIDWTTFNNEQEELKKVYDKKFTNITHSQNKQISTNKSFELPSIPQWEPIGPLYNRKLGVPTEFVSFIASMTICKANPNIMYFTTESGEVYKSVDRGENWSNMTLNYDIASEYNGLKAIAVNPNNPDEVITSGDGVVYKSTNGGLSWIRKTTLNAVGACYQIIYHPTILNTIYFAGNDGLFISTDGGETITPSSLPNVFRINLHPTNSNIIYAVTKVGVNPYFYRSTNSGSTWQQLGLGNGWYSANSPDASISRVHIGVSKAAPDVVYVLLNGNSKAGDNNFIGLFKSTNQGVNWSLTHDHMGSPYTASNPNLVNGRAGLSELAVSNQNADHVLVGAVTIFASYDGGNTFADKTNASPYNVHFDIRQIYPDDEGMWICNDGGLTFTTDALQSHREMKALGVHSQDFWGFDVGWHNKTMVGGLYHNGVTAWSENFPDRNFMNIQGGEPAIGNVNPHDSNMVYGKGTVIRLPNNINTNSSIIKNISKQHSQVSWVANNSKFIFHPNNYNTFYFGDNANPRQLWKTEDNGDSFSMVHEFNVSTDLSVYEIEISSNNPNVMYVTLGGPFKTTPPELYKTINGGATWIKLNPPVPATINTTYLISIDPENENNIWLGVHTGYYITAGKFFTGINGNQVHKSTDGGNTWQNISTPTLNGEVCTDIANVSGTDGGTYLFTQNSVYYRDNTMADWEIQNNGMPFYVETNFGKVWYKGGKIVLGTFGRCIWQSDINTPMSRPVARIMVDKFSTPLVDNGGGCYTSEPFIFDDHSFLRYEDNATNTWQWQFPTGSPSTSTKRSPVVTFASAGTHTITLTVTDVYGNQSTATLEVEVTGDPNVSVAPIVAINKEPEICGDTKGSITFVFPDNPSRNNIEFSIDGGATFPYTVADNIGSFTVSNLSAGSYYASTRWGDGSCSIDLGLVVIGGSGPCTFDCNNDANGTAFIDNCNVCSGGLTGRIPIISGVPEGFTYLADGGQTATLPGLSTVAYGANCGYYYLYGRTGSITFNPATFGGDPALNVLKRGYYKLSEGMVDCNGVQDGVAYIDHCDNCVGGNTGILPCEIIIDPNPTVDEVSFTFAEDVLVANQMHNVTVQYSASTSRDIFVFLQDVLSGSWEWEVEHLKSVSAGTGSFTVNFTIPDLPAVTDGYQWGVFITDPNATDPWTGKTADPVYVGGVDIDPTLGLGNNALNNKFLIYPNPNNGKFTIELNTSENAELSVFDLLGRNVYSKNIGKTDVSTKIELDLKNKASGMYFVKLTSGNVDHVKKIVLTH